jgi:dihydrofolate synthase / folylpolyglutamate synthase
MSNYSDKIKRLYNLQHFGIKMGLEQVSILLNNLGNPEKTLNFIHIAGTNGKGSVCAILASALKGLGYKVGFYSSPHLVSLRERFRINGEGVSRKNLAELIDYTWPLVEKLYSEDIKLTFFEVTVSMAALYFAKEKCDFVLWETGLGGRLDSTTAVFPIVTAITGIGLDHEKYLGDTEEKIAFEKAGIIKKSIPVFVGKMSDSAFLVIKKVAKENTAPFFAIDKKRLAFSKEIDETFLWGWHFSEADRVHQPDSQSLEKGNGKNRLTHSYYLPLPGEAQPNNMRLAYIILDFLSKKFNFSLNTALESIRNLKWHGRIQQLPDGKIIDGAHNPQGIKSLVKTLQSSFNHQKFTVIFGCLEERNPEKAIEILSQIAENFIFVPIDSSRPCFPPEKILDIAKSIDCAIPCSIATSLREALRHFTKDDRKVVITGSLYLAGETLLNYYSKEEIINI